MIAFMNHKIIRFTHYGNTLSCQNDCISMINLRCVHKVNTEKGNKLIKLNGKNYIFYIMLKIKLNLKQFKNHFVSKTWYKKQ